MERVVAYIDGYNLYYGLRSKGWKHFYWLNIQTLIENLLKQNQSLSEVKYFTTVVTSPTGRHKRQAIFLEAVQTLSDVHIFYGHFLSENISCRNCGHVYTTYHEKMTDVNIAVELLSDAYQDRFDTALLVSADSDLVGPVKAVKTLFPSKRVIIVFPPKRQSYHLKQAAHGYTFIGRDVLSRSLFPQQIKKADGYRLKCPTEWR